MYKHILESAGNINWMAIFALGTFFFIFSVSAIMAFKSDKGKLNHMSNLPLQEDDPIVNS